ncbi:MULTISPECIES: DUF1810 domain-containing protein [unclassified Bradyrhizobium]|uniref:DUF1810 domain-containing protein n=1 Tax=unclassified Bradyrhizobium TaxID=2631580 RepID=UPI001FF7432C|nr:MULTISPECIES: DUF1810 domain-containing protein [unclassified Bradyrhizobium]MCK1711443.1 DUF1810 domain-containing protein [Bradyrhizobium sp. 143]MCK1728899.1 DUF1810 domain-containing protein [Bradyrhizobium sp. 142]
MTDPFNLNRFVQAQNPIYSRVIGELSRGRKQSHWMWFIFPQIAGLGLSAMSQRYAIGSRKEAEAYLAHPVLGARLVECTGLVLAVQGRTIHAILGAPDDAKFRSSMTLFGAVSDQPIFSQALERYFSGERDGATLEMLSKLDRLA